MTGEFNLEITEVTLNGLTYAVESFPIGLSHNGVKPTRVSIANGPGVASLIQTLLDHTEHLEPVTLGLAFAGGISVSAPDGVVVACRWPVPLGWKGER